MNVLGESRRHLAGLRRVEGMMSGHPTRIVIADDHPLFRGALRQAVSHALAGAEVSDAFGRPLAYNKHDPRDFGVLVCSPAIHASAVARLAERAKALR